MKFQALAQRLAAVALFGASILGAGGAAQAREVYWSVGVGSPGVQVNASNAPPIVYGRPVVVVPQPTYHVQPPVVYGPPQVVYGPPRLVVAPQPYYVQSGWAQPTYGHGWAVRHHRRHGHWDRGDHDYDRDYNRQGFGGPRGDGNR